MKHTTARIRFKAPFKQGSWQDVDISFEIPSQPSPKSMEKALVDCKTFKARLRGARRFHFLTQEALAELSGVSPASIKRYETAPASYPGRERIDKLAAALSCDPLWLLYG